MTDRERNKLKSKLPSDWAEKVADKASCSSDYARKILNGSRQNIQVMKTIIAVASDHQNELKAIQQNIAEL